MAPYLIHFSVLVWLLLCCQLERCTIWAFTENATASSRFKAPNNESTPNHIAELWKQQDEALWDYVNKNIPAVLDHTGADSFDVHLKGVQAVLRYWNAPEYLCNAGLFHSIYGTEGFQGFALPLSERPVIQNLIGKEAEKLCWIFCMVDRSTVDQTVFDYEPTTTTTSDVTFTFRSRPELGRFDIHLSKSEWLDFLELTLADWLEQVEGAATKPSDIFLWKTGQAYSYRRTAYKKMRYILSIERQERLSKVVQDMHKAVYDTESLSTRHLVQPRTPPMSRAASDALNALRSNGEDIPIDLSPQPTTADINPVIEIEEEVHQAAEL